MEFEDYKNEENLLSGISYQTPSKDGTDQHFINSFQVSPTFQQSQQKQQENNYFKSELIINPHYADQQQKNNELSFSLNNQSIKQDNCFFQQIYEKLAKLEMDLNNQSLHESYSDIKSSIMEFQVKYCQQLNFNTSDQIPEYQNVCLPQSSESKHLRTRSEANLLTRNINPKTKINEHSNISQKLFDSNIFLKQSEEYSLLFNIIKSDLENFENSERKDYDQSMELINHYYKLRNTFQIQMQEKDYIIQNIQNYLDQTNFTIAEFEKNFDTLTQGLSFHSKNLQVETKEELVSLVILKIQELDDSKLQLEKQLIDSQQEQLEQQKIQNQQLMEYEKVLQSYKNLDNSTQLLLQEKENQEVIIKSLSQEILILKQYSKDNKINFLRQNLEQLMIQIKDFTILSTKLLQHIFNQTGANLSLKDCNRFNEQYKTLQDYFQSQDIGNIEKLSENFIEFQSEIEVQKKQICIQFQGLVQQIRLQRQQLMDTLYI
ncbi:unnamed protein product [Paramecium sonneborni]|uniref:Uncharacterized protein n=1 Tax=Paramecium sonneborni TaxID=65129 RepID=A0A8S1LVR9_9CILI|nr:unnamed protein product [Paramecium sonneborni]